MAQCLGLAALEPLLMKGSPFETYRYTLYFGIELGIHGLVLEFPGRFFFAK